MKFKRNKKALLSLFILTTLAGTLCANISMGQELPPDTPQQPPLFSDVDEGDSFFIPITYLKEHGLVDGYEDGTFQPYQEVNRAEALKILLEAFPIEEEIPDPTLEDIPEDIAPPIEVTDPKQNEIAEQPDLSFPDVSSSEWYFPYVQKALKEGIVEGYPDKKFHPEKTINRAEALKIVLLHEDPDFTTNVEDTPYSDVSSEDWFAPFAQISKERTLFLPSRNDGNLDPADTVSRAEFAELIYRLIKTKEDTLFARATWYGSEGVNWGTASGEPFDVNKMATAHKTLPFGTKIKVTNQANGKSVIVEVNDRGPYATGIDIDLTQTAFSEIASVGAGIIITEYEILEIPASNTETPETIIPIVEEYGF